MNANFQSPLISGGKSIGVLYVGLTLLMDVRELHKFPITRH